MKVALDLNDPELVLLYLATGNEDAGRIVCAAAREYARIHPPEKKPRGRKKSEQS
jgi:hypothetical protein